MRGRLLQIARCIPILIISLCFISCEEEDGKEKLISSFDSDESHRTGENCMNCHTKGGKGEGWFTVAGTVYDSTLETTFPNSLVSLYQDASGAGSPEITIEVDALGNFYTTEEIDFNQGLYAAVTGNMEKVLMIGPITDGQCNSCHGHSAERIWVK
jgi:hypothetical protein